MNMRRRFAAAAIMLLATLGAAHAQGRGPLKVVASFSILGDMVRNVGGTNVAITTLVGPNNDTHVYQPTPADARAIADAKIVFVNGLGFEGWMERLVKASGTKAKVVVASTGLQSLTMIEEEDGKRKKITDPHAWQDLRRGQIYVHNIAAGLIEIDPAHAAQYRANADAYLLKLTELDAWVVQQLEAIPREQRKVITSHDAFGYFGNRYGVTFRAPQGVSTESEASAKDVAALIRQIRKERIRAIFMENMTDSRLLERLAKEGGAVIGGTLYADALSDPSGPAATYSDMFRNNVPRLAAAMTQAMAQK